MSEDEAAREATHVEADEPEGAARDEEGSPPIEIPFERLSAAAQAGVLEEFVTREGTDYGHVEVPLEAKVAAVRAQIERGEVVLLFDPRTEQVNLVARRELRGAR